MIAQKPSIRAVPQVNKAAAIAVTDAESRTRRSTSSVPRGRCSSPSEFIRVSVDSRMDRRVSVDRVRGPVGGGRGSSGRGSESNKQTVGVKDLNVMVAGGGPNELRVYRELKGNVKLRASMDSKLRISEAKQHADDEKIEDKPLEIKVLGSHSGEGIDETILSDENGRSSIIFESGFAVNEARKEKFCIVAESRIVDRRDVNSSLESEQKDLEIVKECTGNKYPSKLHEKLAFLEGKVKRIASDIKKTKEMLDLNGTGSSKLILSDIQKKISGIEKAIGHGAVSSGTNEKDIKMGLKDEANEADINTKELEERLFPHRKLLRNGMSMKSTSDTSQSNEIHTIDDNPVALEFMEQTKVTMRSEQVQEMEGNPSAGLQESSTQFKGKQEAEFSNEILDNFDDQENKQGGLIDEETDDTSIYQMNEIGTRTSIGGWFVSEGEAVLLAHNDGSCSFYDITNTEVFQISLW